MPYFVLHSQTEFLILVLCNVHIRLHPLDKHQEQIALLGEGNSDFILWMVRAWSPLCCHGNVVVDHNMKLCDEYNNSTKFQVYTEKGLRDIPFFLFYIILRPSCDVTSLLLCINQNLEQLGNQECYYNKRNAILHYFKSSS